MCFPDISHFYGFLGLGGIAVLGLFLVFRAKFMRLSSMDSQAKFRGVGIKSLTKNLELISASPVQVTGKEGQPSLLVKSSAPGERPLSVMLCWMAAKNKHIMKYAQFYLDQGFDVLTVKISPWQLLWPMKGSQLLAGSVLEFLRLNEQYQSTLLHGFSVGGYLWGEALVQVAQDPKKYTPVIDRIVGQIWDSIVDFHGIPTGFPKALFPNNAMLRKSFEAYIRYHMKTFHNTATIHYYNSSDTFHQTMLKAPALFLFSKSDPIGTAQGNLVVQKKWEEQGIKTFVKCWERSPHVSHYHHHPEEYQAELCAFLSHLGLLAHPEKLKARL